MAPYSGKGCDLLKVHHGAIAPTFQYRGVALLQSLSQGSLYKSHCPLVKLVRASVTDFQNVFLFCRRPQRPLMMCANVHLLDYIALPMRQLLELQGNLNSTNVVIRSFAEDALLVQRIFATLRA